MLPPEEICLGSSQNTVTRKERNRNTIAKVLKTYKRNNRKLLSQDYKKSCGFKEEVNLADAIILINVCQIQV